MNQEIDNQKTFTAELLDNNNLSVHNTTVMHIIHNLNEVIALSESMLNEKSRFKVPVSGFRTCIGFIVKSCNRLLREIGIHKPKGIKEQLHINRVTNDEKLADNHVIYTTIVNLPEQIKRELEDMLLLTAECYRRNNKNMNIHLMALLQFIKMFNNATDAQRNTILITMRNLGIKQINVPSIGAVAKYEYKT